MRDLSVELIDALEQLTLATAHDPRRTIEVKLELGRLCLHRADTRAAIKHYEAVVGLDASNREALESLTRLFDQEHSPSDLARVLERFAFDF